MKEIKDSVKLFGRYQIFVTDKDDNIVLDYGWKENVVTDLGIRNYFIKNIGGLGGYSISHGAIGFGAAPVHTDSALNGEVNRVPIISNTIIDDKTLETRMQFSTLNFDIGVTPQINNVGMFNAITGGIMYCGSSYAPITLFPDQRINIYYQIGVV